MAKDEGRSGEREDEVKGEAEVMDLRNEDNDVVVVDSPPDARKGKRPAPSSDVAIVDERAPKAPRYGTTTCHESSSSGAGPGPASLAANAANAATNAHYSSLFRSRQHASSQSSHARSRTPGSSLADSVFGPPAGLSWVFAGGGGAARINGNPPANASSIAGLCPESLSLMMRELTSNDYDFLRSLDENVSQPNRIATDNDINYFCTEETVTVDREESPDTRCFCLDTPTIGDSVLTLPCSHWFHKDCIRNWLKRDKSCPICKKDMDYTAQNANTRGKRARHQ